MIDPSTTRLGPKWRWVVVVFVFVVSPVFAEFSSGYLASTGNPGRILTELLVFAPFYGGATLLIREVAVRARFGWTGVALLATAVGLLHASVIDASIFTLTGTGIEYWPQIMAPTWVDGAGVAVGAAVGWSLGHALFSFGAPLVLLVALFPSTAGRPALGPFGVVLVAAGYLVVCVMVHVELAKTYRPIPTAVQYAGAVALALAIAAPAFTAVGCSTARNEATPTAPLTRGTGPSAGLAAAVALGAVLGYLVDTASQSWMWTAACLVAAIGSLGVLRWWARRPGWSARHAPAVVVGALLTRAVNAFATPPAAGVNPHAALAHHVIFLLVVVAMAGLVLARTASLPPVTGEVRTTTTLR